MTTTVGAPPPPPFLSPTHSHLIQLGNWPTLCKTCKTLHCPPFDRNKAAKGTNRNKHKGQVSGSRRIKTGKGTWDDPLVGDSIIDYHHLAPLHELACLSAAADGVTAGADCRERVVAPRIRNGTPRVQLADLLQEKIRYFPNLKTCA